MLRVILGYRLKIWWRKLRRGRAAARFGAGFSVAAFLLITLSVSNMGYQLAASARRTGPQQVGNLLELPLFALFVFVALSGVSVALNELYIASDIELLLTAPLRPRTLFALKLLDCAMPATPVAAGSLAFVAGFALATHQGIVFYGLALVVAALLSAGLTALVLAIVLALAQVFPARRMRDAVLLLSSVVGVGVAVLWALFIQRGQRGPRGGSSFVDGIPAPDGWIRWTPPGAAAAALVHAARGEAAQALIAGALLALFVAVAGAVAHQLFARVFLASWSAMREQAPRRRRVRAPRESGRQTSAALAIARKDWRTAGRDWPYLSALLPSAFYGIAYPLILLRLSIGRGVAGQWWAMTPLIVTPLLVAALPALSAIGREGQALGALRATPVRPASVLLGKILAAGLPTLVLTALAGALIPLLRGAPASIVAAGALLGLLLAAGCTAIGVSIGTLRPNFEQSANARPRTSSAGCLLYLALAALFVGGVAALAATAIAATLGRLSARAAPTLWITAALVCLVGLIALLSAVGVAHVRVRSLLAPEE